MNKKNVIALALIAGLLVGCGQSGPLYLPSTKPAKSMPAKTAPVQTNTQQNSTPAAISYEKLK